MIYFDVCGLHSCMYQLNLAIKPMTDLLLLPRLAVDVVSCQSAGTEW